MLMTCFVNRQVNIASQHSLRPIITGAHDAAIRGFTDKIPGITGSTFLQDVVNTMDDPAGWVG